MESKCLSHLSICVGLSVQKVYCGKMADWIRMLFGMMSGVSRGMGVLDWGPRLRVFVKNWLSEDTVKFKVEVGVCEKYPKI